MTFQKFEDIPIYQSALLFCKNIYQVTNKSFGKDFALIDQIRRASISIVLNIAEGFDRGTNPQFANFINYSKASAGEVRAALSIAKEVGYLDQETYKNLYFQVVKLNEDLSKFRNFLRSSAKTRNKK